MVLGRRVLLGVKVPPEVLSHLVTGFVTDGRVPVPEENAQVCLHDVLARPAVTLIGEFVVDDGDATRDVVILSEERRRLVEFLQLVLEDAVGVPRRVGQELRVKRPWSAVGAHRRRVREILLDRRPGGRDLPWSEPGGPDVLLVSETQPDFG